jgi:RNA-directed DNA polymerase
MEDTQRSQTISTQNRKTAEQSIRTLGKSVENPENVERPPLLVRESTTTRIRILAENNPDLVFTSLAHRNDLYLLGQSFLAVRKNKAGGVDKVTATEYAENLDPNLYNLYMRLRRGQYAAQPVKRIWIDKENGKKRPIGIPALEDKIVQKAVSTLFDPTQA